MSIADHKALLISLGQAWASAGAAAEDAVAKLNASVEALARVPNRSAPAGLATSVIAGEQSGSIDERLKLAQQYLQYLEDIGQKESADYQKQLQIVADLQKHSDAYAKSLREATIELEQSPQFKALISSIAQAKADAEAGKEALAAEEETANAVSDHTKEISQAVTDAQQKLADMADAAGTTTASGPGKAVADLSAQLKDAQARLQYLTDTGKGGSREFADTQKAITKLTADLETQQKALRVATYEFEHSDAYAAQQKAIADEREALKAQQEAEAAERAKLEKMRDEQDAREKRATELDEQRQKQIDDLATAAANAVTTAETAATAAFGRISNAVADGTKAMADAADQAVQKVTTAVETAARNLSGGSKPSASGASGANRPAGPLGDLFDLIAGGSGSSSSTPFANEGFDPKTGEKTGGSINDAYYAELVKAYIAAKGRLRHETGLDQIRDAQAVTQLNALWQQLGGYDRFHKTLDQILREYSPETVAPLPSPTATVPSSVASGKGGVSLGALPGSGTTIVEPGGGLRIGPTAPAGGTGEQHVVIESPGLTDVVDRLERAVATLGAQWKIGGKAPTPSSGTASTPVPTGAPGSLAAARARGAVR